MAFHPQRFIHAANIRLDVPVSVQTTERPGDQLRMEFEDATLQAFDAVIENCLRHDVDFLLLTGNVFIEADRSLRARLAILKGFQRLREREIQVFVVPGDMDPAEAWRAIPEMSDNVSVCYSSNPEPEELVVDDQPVTMVSSSTWLGNVDDFGIQVIARGGESVQPFRIGVISRARFEESRRIAAVAAASGDHVLGAVAVNPATSELVIAAQQQAVEQEETGVTVWRSLETDGRSRPTRADDLRPGQQGGAGPSAGGSEESPDSGFLRYADEMLREAQLHFLALTGELSPSTSWRESGVVHSPGTTQPRSRLEAVSGTCSLVQVAEDGTVKISSLDTSCVDWKHLEIRVSAGMDLSTLLQQMKTRLLETRSGASDRIWSVQWILRGSLPLLHSLLESDLDTALGVELDEVMSSVRSIRLLHDVQTLPDPWPVSHPTATLADQYQQLLTRPAMLRDADLQRLIDNDGTLSNGWKQRLTSVLPSLDPERILARLREDGAGWFEPAFNSDVVEAEQEVPESSGDEDRFEESDAEEHEDAVAAATGEVVAEAYEDAEDDDEGELR